MTGKTLRFTNFIIDTSIFLVLVMVVVILFLKNSEPIHRKLVSMAIYFLYYFIPEYCKGQSIGKMITKSFVVSTKENRRFYFSQIIVRTLVRFIPIDILSYLFFTKGLHDVASQTNVETKNSP